MINVAVIDDDKTTLMMIEAILKNLGYGVETLSDPKKALVKLMEELPDVIISDIHMPDLDGNNFAMLVKDMQENVSVPIIALSADKPSDNFMSLFDAVLKKPISPEDLDSTIKEVLASR